MIRERFSEHIRNYLSDDSWMILEDHYDPEENLKYESLFCLSNGYLGTRGAYEERAAKSIPCTYINGVFDKSETFMRELANLPDWLGIKLYVEKELIGIETCRVLEFSRALDMKHALLVKRFVLEDKKGRRTEVEGIRMVSRANVHRMGIRLFVTPLNYSGIIEVENIIDGSVINFCDAPRFKVKHTRLLTNCPLTDKGAYVEVTTRDRKLCVGTGSLMEAYAGGRPVMKNRSFGAFGETAVEFQDFDAEEGKAVEVVKYASVYTEREVPDCHGDSCTERASDHFRYIHARIFSIYGPGDHPWSLVESCLKTFPAGGYLSLGECTQMWNFLYLDDLLEALIALWLSGAEGIFNVAGESGETRPLREYVRLMYEECGCHGSYSYGMRPQNAEGPANLIPDVKKLMEATNWRQEIPFQEGIQRLLQRKNI